MYHNIAANLKLCFCIGPTDWRAQEGMGRYTRAGSPESAHCQGQEDLQNTEL